MPKSKWDDAKEPTINKFYKTGNRSFWICSFKYGTRRSIDNVYSDLSIQDDKCTEMSIVLVHATTKTDK